ncbi:MAG: hypothetical protein QM599_01305 [Pseudoxanthomonas sp.]
MDSSDQLTLQDLADSRIAVGRMRFRSLMAAGIGGVFFSALFAALFLWRHPAELGASLFLAGIVYLVFGLPLLIHWLRHWRKIYARISSVEQQVKAGQVVYGSQVKF